jgi:hypothetical protein
MVDANRLAPMRPIPRALLLVLLILLCSCFVRKRTVPNPGGAKVNRPLLTATKDELIARVRAAEAPIQSFSVRADISPSVGALYGGELTDYATIRASILFRKPDDIRIIGLDPVVHSATIFDMVSMGRDFRVWIPSKNRFIEGDNDTPPSSTNKLENLRPTAFLTSLLIEPPNSKSDLTVLEDDTDESKAVYILMIMRMQQGELRVIRNIYFDRYTLEISRQKTFTPTGEVVSETKYADWKPFGPATFPSTITIRRPRDGYEVVLDVVEMHINPPEVTDPKFVLAQPPGSELHRLK